MSRGVIEGVSYCSYCGRRVNETVKCAWHYLNNCLAQRLRDEKQQEENVKKAKE